jgi:hypothetical protein
MKRIALTLMIGAAVAMTACDDGSSTLTNGRSDGTGGSNDPNATAGGPDTTFDHSNDPGAAVPGADPTAPEPSQARVVGSPEVTARLHSCGKLTYASLGKILATRGMDGKGTGRPAGSQSGLQIYNASSAALGAANYSGRVPEAPFASTSNMSKMFDVFAMASYDVVSANYTATACGATKVLGADGKFTKDGISCIIGKPATDAHVALANEAITKNPTDGAKIAIAALLSAAHTCQ